MRSAKSVAECHADQINKAFAHHAGHRKLQSRDSVDDRGQSHGSRMPGCATWHVASRLCT